jgi:menaquinone-dependent protoporphyrinogen oxidase
MASVLILFASIDGQTERIARRIGAVLDHEGHAVTFMAEHEPGLTRALEESDAVIVGGGIRVGHHSRHLAKLVHDYRGSIDARPNAFFSVCLSAGGPGARPATAKGYIDDFIRTTGWQPASIASFAGALRYSRYNPFIRFLMKLIMGAAGGETDTSGDYEYTDWVAVDRFAGEFARRLETVAASA